MTIGEALKQVRLQAGLTQTQMAAGLITESFYSKVERGVHSIDADTLINLLAAHHFDVLDFFNLILSQRSEGEPDYDLINQISFAQNHKDLKTLDKIKAQLEARDKKPNFNLESRLQIAYAWVLHSNKMVSPLIKQKIKSKILAENWNRQAYHYLSQIVVLLDIEEAFILMKSAIMAFKKNQQFDTLSLQFICLASINFLNCCYYQKAPKQYVDYVVEFLRTLPVDPVIGFYEILGTYYEALFNDDTDKIKWIAVILKQSGYLTTVVDTLPEEVKHAINYKTKGRNV